MKARLQQSAATVVDSLYRFLNGKRHLPTWSLRANVGFPADFEITGAEFLAYLKLLCGLKSHYSILDIGCGCGMMALQLQECLSAEGRYVGMDIDRTAIRWCQSHITSRKPNFTFYHVDVQNPRYNPAGKMSATDYRFPQPSDCFDVIILKSVFTHMRPDALGIYLAEVARLLKPMGRCLATFFLLNDSQPQPDSAFSFDYAGEGFRYADPALPEKAIAHPEDQVLKMLRRLGLRLTAPPYYGSWSGRPDGLSFQDILVIAKG